MAEELIEPRPRGAPAAARARRGRRPAPPSATCARSSAASIRRCWPTAGWPARCRRSRWTWRSPSRSTSGPARAAAGAGRVGRLLRRRRVPGQHRQARRGRARLGRTLMTTTDDLLSVVVGDDGRGGADPAAGTGMRGGDAAAGGVRRHDEGVEPGRRARPSSPWRCRATCPRRGPRPPPGRPDPAPRGARLHDRGTRSTTRPSSPGRLRDPTADAAVVDVRLPPTFTDEGLRAAIAARAARPGFPVLVLSQYVEQLYARELLASGEGAVGYLLKDRVGRRRASSSTASDGSPPAAPCSTPRSSPP